MEESMRNASRKIVQLRWRWARRKLRRIEIWMRGVRSFASIVISIVWIVYKAAAILSVLLDNL
jgi:hypothetical protein